MNKIDGLRFLNTYFPDIALNGYVISDVSKAKDILDKFSYCDGCFWRIRTANPNGSEYALPMGTYYNDKEILEFVKINKAKNRDFQFILHRVNDRYLKPGYCGTLVVDNKSSTIIVDLQKFTEKRFLSMDTGMRPRDWNVCITFEYRFLNKFPIISNNDFSFNLQTWKYEIFKLFQVGVEIYDFYDNAKMIETTYTRFNMYDNNKIILNDHRGSLSFV